MTIIQKIDNFLFRFSFSGKAKFMLCVCFIVAIIIFFLFMHIQNPILQSLDYQLSGTKGIQTLNSLLYTYVKENSKQGSMDEENEWKKILLEATEKNELLLAKLPESRKILLDEAKVYFTILQSFSEKYFAPGTKREEKARLFSKIIETTSYLIYLTSQASELNLTIDSGVLRLVSTLTHSLIPLEMQLTKLIADLEANDKQHRLTKAELIGNSFFIASEAEEAIKQTEGNLEAAFQENLFLHRIPSSKTSIALLEKFKSSTIQWINFLSSPQYPSNEELSLKLTNEVLKDTFALSAQITDQLNLLLSSQLNVLVSRKRAGWNCIIFGIGIVFLMYATKIVRRPVVNLKKSAEKLASGDLSVRIPITTHDEVAQMSQAFNDMARLFEETLTNSIKISMRLAGSSSTIFSTAKDLELNVIRQEEVVHQIATHTKQISYTVNDFANSLKEVNRTASATSQLALAGRTVISEMEITMQKMMEGSKNIVGTLSMLQDKIQNINLVISAIVKIADQSNLLSLNTAIRAQKTGLKGVGFSVVAEKIKDLANQIASTTLGIEQTIKEIVIAVEEAVEEVDKFSMQILLQVEDATEVSGQLKSLINNTQEQISIFERVNLGMQEQTTGVTLIHEALLKQTEGSKQTSHSMSKLYKEIEYLYHATNNLLELTKKFHIKDDSLPPMSGQFFLEQEAIEKPPPLGLPEGI